MSDAAVVPELEGVEEAASGRGRDFVLSLERGLAVIKAFDREHSRLTLADVARTTGMTRAAARRFLLTLVELGYMDVDGRVFSLRPRILELGHAYLSSLSLNEVAAVHMERLVVQVHESSSVAVLDGDDIVYVVRVPTARIMTVAISVGTRFPAHATSLGRVLLASLSDADFDAYLDRAVLAPLTRRTITDPDTLRRAVVTVAAQGYSVVDQELEDGLRSIAVPVLDGAGGVVAALNVSTHASRTTLDGLRRDVLPALQATAEAISTDLATLGRSQGPGPGSTAAPVSSAGGSGRVRTQVGIVGAGPAGLMLSHLLATAGIDSVVLEARDRAYVEARVRAGVLEAGTVSLLEAVGVADRLHAEGLVHDGVILQFGEVRHRIDFQAATGKSVTVYGQQEVVRDLIAARVGAGLPTHFAVSDVSYEGIGAHLEGGESAIIRYRHEDRDVELHCDVVAGCDGSHGISAGYVRDGAAGVRTYERDHPFAWLGILARVPPSVDELVYAFGPRGFAMHSLRSPAVSRLYLQVAPDEDLAAWPDERIWAELQLRLAHPGWSLQEGPVAEKGITPMRSHVVEPMRHGRLFLAGDAAHIVPPTGAKGLNLAIADVAYLADALVGWYAKGDTVGLDRYSDRCLARVWRVQDFSTTMTTLLHVDHEVDDFGRRLQLARQDEIVRSQAASTNLAENYVGLPLHTTFA